MRVECCQHREKAKSTTSFAGSNLDCMIDTGDEEEEKRSVQSSCYVNRTMGRLRPSDYLFDSGEQTSTFSFRNFVVQRGANLNERFAVESVTIENLNNGEELPSLTGCDHNIIGTSVTYSHGVI